MPRPFAAAGLTVFAVGAMLYNAPGRTVAVCFAAFALLFALSLCFRPLRDGKVFPAALGSAAIICLILVINNEFFFYPQTRMAGETHDVSVTVLSDARVEYGNCYYEGRLTRSDGEKAYAKVRLVLPADSATEPYDELKGSFTFYALGSSSASVADYYKTENRFLGAYPSGEGFETVHPQKAVKAPGYYIIKFRAGIKNTLMRLLPNDYGALCLALLLGDRSELSRTVYSDMTRSGITHIICVSGLHLTIWTGLVLFVLRRLRLGEKAAAALTLPAVFLIMLAAGMTYSVIRAGIMAAVYLLSVILSRRRDALNSLGIALLVTGAFNPYAMGAVSLKLSVLSTLGITVYAEYCSKGVKEFFSSHSRIRAFMKPAELILITGAAVLFCLPVTLEVYGTVNLAVFISNLLVIWAGEACMVISALAVVIASFSASVFNLPGLVAGALAKYIIKVTSVISRIEILTFRIPAQSARLLLCCVFLLCALIAFLAYSGKKVLPAAPAVLAATVIFCAVFSASCRYGETRVKVFDTGNGTAVLVSEKSRNVLIGCGGTTYNGAEEIASGISDEGGRLDAVIIPSPDKSFASFFYGVCSGCVVDSYHIAQTVDTIGLNIPDGAVFDAGESFTAGGIEVAPLSGDDSPGYMIKTDDITLAVLTFPWLYDGGDGLSRDADVLVTRMDYPGNAEFPSLVYTVIEAENARGCALQDELISQGINAAATAENGAITLNAYKGKINLEREEK